MESLAAKTEWSEYYANYASQSAVLPRRLLAFQPNGTLCIQKPSLDSIDRRLKINNSSTCPVIFKIKTTHPRLYYALPNYGRIEARQSAIVNIGIIPLSGKVVSNRKPCVHKFLVEVFPIVPERNISPFKDTFERSTLDSHRHKFWVVYALTKGLFQVQTSELAATVVYSTTEKDSKQKQTDSPNGSREDTPLFGEDQLSLGITEEKVKDMPGGGLYTVHGRDMHMSFCPVDRLYFRKPLTRSTSRSLILNNDRPYLIPLKLDTNVTKALQICETCASAGSMMLDELSQNPAKMAPHELPTGLQPPAKTEENTDSAAQTENDVKRLCQRMNVSSQPSDGSALCFQRPLTRPISRTLMISNRDTRPMAYMVRATNPQQKSYFVRPSSGQIDPGQNVHIAVERKPSVIEPNLDEKCQDQFLVEISAITSPRQDFPIGAPRDVYKNSIYESEDRKFYRINVDYLPEEGLTPEEAAEYEAGMAHLIPEEPFCIYPNTYLCFKRPFRNPSNSIVHVTISNISAHPMAFMALLTAQNAQMYTVNPTVARIESGEYLKIQVRRMPMKVEPPAHEPCPDVFSFLGTLFHPEQENLDPSDVFAHALSNKYAIFQQKLPVLFIPWKSLTPNEELINQRKGLFDRLQDIEDLEEAGGSNTRGLDETSEDDVYQKQITEAQRALIQQWSLSITPNTVGGAC